MTLKSRANKIIQLLYRNLNRNSLDISHRESGYFYTNFTIFRHCILPDILFEIFCSELESLPKSLGTSNLTHNFMLIYIWLLGLSFNPRELIHCQHILSVQSYIGAYIKQAKLEPGF